jgi:hypothetical protein
MVFICGVGSQSGLTYQHEVVLGGVVLSTPVTPLTTSAHVLGETEFLLADRSFPHSPDQSGFGSRLSFTLLRTGGLR